METQNAQFAEWAGGLRTGVHIPSGNSLLIIVSAWRAAAFAHFCVSAVRSTHVPWRILATTIPAVLVGGQFAAVVARRIPQERLPIVLLGVLLFLGALNLYRAIIASHVLAAGAMILVFDGDLSYQPSQESCATEAIGEMV